MSPGTNRGIYAAVYTDLAAHRKVRAIPETDRLAAVGFYVLALALCQALRSDGFIATFQLAAVAPCPETEAQRFSGVLVSVGLFDAVADGVQVHDYLDHNKSRDEIEAAREAMSKGGSKGGKRSAETRREKGEQQEGEKEGSPPLKPTLEASCSAVREVRAVKEEPCRASRVEASGASKALGTVPCPDCDGTGHVDGAECPACWGTGVVSA